MVLVVAIQDLGGWGAILIYNEHQKEIFGNNSNTTNNIMEMTAVVEALKLLKEKCDITIHSDSAYVVNAFEKGWINNWQKNNWKTADKKPVKNMELWQEMIELLNKHDYKFVKVKGHSDNELNNRCDYLATSAIKSLENITS